jgi:tripartite-type tricarboxylate transporter receptor subunit TctC
VLLAVIAALLALQAVPATAQDYPSRPIRMVTMFAPGSATDHRSRFFSVELGKQLKQPIVVENKGGASGLLATLDVLRAQPAGYNLLYGSNMLSGNIHMFKDAQYKLEDFTTVGVLGMTPFALITRNVPASSLGEFIAYAKANPGKLNFGSLGPTSGQNLLAERLKHAAGIEMVGVPYKGGDPMAQGFFSGDIQLYFATLNTALQRMKQPGVRGIATAAEQRSRLLSSLPTFKELGYPTINMIQWDAIFVPRQVSEAMVKRLVSAIALANASPENKTFLDKLEREPWPGTIAQFNAYIKEEGEQMGADIKRLGIRPEN